MALATSAFLSIRPSLPVRQTIRQQPPRSAVSISQRLPRRSVAAQADNRYGSPSAVEGNTSEAVDDASVQVQEFFEDLAQKWEDNEEKPTTVLLGVAAFVTLWAAGGLVDAINRLPLIGGFFEVVGLGVTGWFIYRYLIDAESRSELSREVDSFTQKVGISKK